MEYEQTLAPGTVLNGEFRIKGLLGSGGFANTYLAEDLTLGREVAIKEFFPAELAVRANSKSVSVKSNAQSSQFEWARSRFVREAKTLAKFLHPSVVRVFRVFDANNTAYIVLEFVRGSNMGTWLKRMQRPPNQDEFDILLPPLLDALEVVHRAGILHRDIKPANIYIREIDHMPVLLDFGAAKYATAADNAGTTAAIVSKGYSPNEAYSTDTRLQGPWTDIYGLSATVYRAMTGSAPPESTSRIMHDECILTSDRPELKGLYRPEFLTAIDKALAIMPRHRPQSIAAWRKELFPELAMLQPQVAQLGIGPTSDAEWHPLSDGPSGTETIYSAPQQPSGAEASEAENKSSASGTAAAASVSAARSASSASRAPSFSFSTKDLSLQSATEGLSFVTRTVGRYVRPPEGASNTTFFAGVAMLLIGAVTLGVTMLQTGEDQANTQAATKANIERVARLEAAERERIAKEQRQASERKRVEEETRQAAEAAERKRVAEEKRLAAEAAERKRVAEEKRLAAEAAERKRIAEEKRLAAEAAERKRVAEEKRLAAEAAERKRVAEEKRLAAEAAERKRVAEEKRLAAEAAERKRVAEEKRLAAEAAERKRVAEEKRLAAEAAERKRVAEQKRLAAEAAERKRLAEANRQAEEERRAKEAAERKQLAEAQKRAEEEARARLSGPAKPIQEASSGPLCGGVYSSEIIERCELAQPHRLCACAADLELSERRYQRQAALVTTSTRLDQPQVIAPVVPPTENRLPSAGARRVYLTEIQTGLKARQCYDGSVNGRLEDTQPALENYVTKTLPDGRKIELASATTAEYEDWMRWFRALDEYVCIPLAPRRPEIARRPEPEAEPDRQQKSNRVYRKPRKTIRKPRPPKRTVTRPKKRKNTARRTARKPKSSSSSGASYNSLLRGGR